MVITIVDNLAAKENVTLFAQNAGCEVKVAGKEEAIFLPLIKVIKERFFPKIQSHLRLPEHYISSSVYRYLGR